MALCHKKDKINVLEYDHSCAFSLMSFQKESFCKNHFCLLLLYRSSNIQKNVFLMKLSDYFLNYKIDLILGDFNIDGLDVEASKTLNEVMVDYKLVVSVPTHIDGKLLDHVYASNRLLKHFAYDAISTYERDKLVPDVFFATTAFLDVPI